MMLLASLLLSTAGHDHLHAHSADFYVEVPDVPAALEAAARSPLVRTLRDERLGAFLQELGAAAPEVDPRVSWQRILARVAPGVDATLLRGFSASLTLPRGEGDALSFAIVIDLADAAAADAMGAALAARCQPLGTETDSALGELERLACETLGGLELWLATPDERVLLGAGTDTPEALAQRAAEPGDGPFAREGLGAGREALAATGGETLSWGTQRRSPLELLEELRGLAPELVPEMPLALPFDPLAGARAWRVAFDGERFLFGSFALAESRTLGARPIDAAWLSDVPAEAMFVFASSVDGSALAQRARRLLASWAGADAVQAYEERLGFDLAETGARLGPACVAYSLPLTGPTLPTSFLSLELREPEVFAEEAARACAELEASFPGLSARTRGYTVKDANDERVKIPVTTLKLPPELSTLGGMLSPSPAFAVLEGELLVSLSTITLKRELKARMSGAERATGDPLAVAGVDAVEPPGTLWIFDWGALIGGILRTVRNLGGALGDQLPVDLSQLPPTDVFTRHLRPTVHTTRHLAGGTLSVHTTPLGPALFLALAAELAERPEPEPAPVPEDG